MARFTVAVRTDLLTEVGVFIGDIGTVTAEGLDYEWISGDQANLNNWILVDGSETRKYSGGLPLALGFDVQTNRPLDEREIVNTLEDLKTLPNVYQYIIVKVNDADGAQYKWNGLDQSNLDNWLILGADGVALNAAAILALEAEQITQDAEIAKRLKSDTTGEPTGSTVIGNTVYMTQAAYDAAVIALTVVETTEYVIVG